MVEVTDAGPGPLRVAVLDDDADFVEFIGGVLTSQGHSAAPCLTSDELITTCQAELPDVVLLDMNMGRVSGSEVLAVLRERWPRLCVVVITGHPSMDTMRETFKQDAFDYLAKPFSAADLERVLAQASAEFGLGRRPQDRLRAELGRRIRLARTDLGWTLKDLSEASSVSVSQLSSIERGTHLPSLESLVSIATALRTTPSEWLRSAGF
ncbi:MAG: response regulator [Planctomycetota bacterium]